MNSVVIGTRGSPLALAQTEIVRGLLLKAHPELPLDTKIIKTSGDQFHNLSLTAGGGKGLFTREIEEHLLRGAIQVAVHSMKDLPTVLPEGLTIGAVPARDDAHDVFVSRSYGSLDELPKGASVATSSIRRRVQLLAYRPDLHIEEIRGNVETRLRKLQENSSLHGLILAAAGLNRLGLWNKYGDFLWHRLEHDVMIPAVGQGAIGCEIREDDDGTRALLAAVDDPDTRACVEAERAFLRAMGGGCQVPYAAHATVDEKQMYFIGAKFGPDGRDAQRAEAVGLKHQPRELGEQAANQILG
jgi:hydroxymethylbilane synthase